ncbi:MAG: Uncharacterized protein G01um101416_146 [Microgenomates group bacterium Gr01-1014_16]|nr:MAG: Uncharacterized protein G01um101416_146 [Microgenomates group bacterium Gr01-1014_16]
MAPKIAIIRSNDLKMKTKYILHGGNAQHINSENDKFFAEILKDAKDRVKILLVEFAGRNEKIDLNYQTDKSQFERVAGDKELIFRVATELDFIEQVKKSDVIYFGGGTTIRLMDKLKEYKNLGDLFSGKIVAGESAGANSLSTYCYSKSGGGVIQGLGLVTVKTIPHYTKGMETVFRDITSDIESLLLPNYKFKVFEINQ